PASCCTRAASLTNDTLADMTPGTRVKVRSTVAAQPPQNMPSTANPLRIVSVSAMINLLVRQPPREFPCRHPRAVPDPPWLHAARRRNPRPLHPHHSTSSDGYRS